MCMSVFHDYVWEWEWNGISGAKWEKERVGENIEYKIEFSCKVF